jgi:serine/threonine-protein kinase
MSTPQGRATAPLVSLPSDVIEQSCKRVGILGIVFALFWALALFMGNVVHGFIEPAVRMTEFAFPMPGNVFATIGLAMSLGMVVLAGRLQDRPNLLLDLSLVFMVLTALLIGILNQWIPNFEGRGISWICVVILVYPAIAPNTPGKILLAGVLAASMDPFGLLVTELRGVEYDAPRSALGFKFLANYLCALLAVVPAKMIRVLGRHARRARDLGSYRLGDELGRGGMGTVHRAEHRLLARQAAIKLIRPELLGARDPDTARIMVERFKREAQASASLRSPHTIELYDFGATEDGAFYYVMELLDGMSLDELIERNGPVPAERAIAIIRQVCLSLAEAHARGLIHRDVKPSNIFLTRMGLQVDFVKVLDFGLVKAQESREQTLLTQQGMTTGTPAYMAPEMAMGESDIDSRVDVYAVGCVLYYLLTGQLVFEADTPMKMMHRHISDAPAPPSHRTELPIPAELEQLVMDCLAKVPDGRPASGAAVAQRLTVIPVREPWTDERAHRWWHTNRPETLEECACDQGVLCPAMVTA